ncbi:TMEM165/GDT1 family protein [Clostridiisalibacter paucivorans]|uniref:TMEM165/GDT1 family protein n=1 Tax=Clostridiisalibacter paucivorans TaxID=408753 RepID=UPI0006862B3D|nr:TMEM165/GDT1 family protein [Clostridiisalibacter paucivorans]
MGEIIKAFIFIFVAEMGDKTQILAMTFATKYSVKKVLLGVFLGSLLNHGIAVALGSYLSNKIPLNLVQLFAGILFIGFGLWTLKPEGDEDDQDAKGNGLGPVLTVAMAFFIGELGDKTQLTAMTLATESSYPLFILMGTVLGMVFTSSIGIFVGSKIGDKIPEIAIKIVSAFIFILFGTIKLYQQTPERFLNTYTVLGFSAILCIIIAVLLRSVFKSRRNRITSLKGAATSLYIHTTYLKRAVNHMCLGTERCKHCQGINCPIGFTKEVLNESEKTHRYKVSKKFNILPKNNKKPFERYEAIKILAKTLGYIELYNVGNDEDHVFNKAREAMEIILFDTHLYFSGDIKEYLNTIIKLDNKVGKEVEMLVSI